MKSKGFNGVASLGSWTGYTGKVVTSEKGTKTTFSFLKTKTKKGVNLIIDGKIIAIVSRGIPKLTDDPIKANSPRHQVRLCKGVKIEDLQLSWREFIEWANCNISQQMIKEKSWIVRLVSPEEVQKQRADLIQDRIKSGRENDYGGI